MKVGTGMSLPRQHPYIDRLKTLFAAGRIGRRDFLREATLLGVAAGAAYAFVDRVSGRTAPQTAQTAQVTRPRGGRVRIGLRVADVGRPHRFSWWEPEIARQVLSSLTKTGPDNITRPHLLERWDVSDDLRSWTLFLRPDLRWRKGGRLVADHVIWNLRQVLDPAVGSPALGLMGSYMLSDSGAGANGTAPGLWDANAIEKVDDLTLRLNLRRPQVAVPQHLQHGTLGIQDPEEGGVFGPGSNGAGPFELVEIEPGRGALLRAVADYWEGVGPYLDAVEFVDTGDDPAAAVAALAERRVDGLYRTDIHYLDAIKGLDHLRIYEAESSWTAVARMKVTEKPFDDPRVRRAMRLAIDPHAVLRVAHAGMGLPGEHHHVCAIQLDYARLPFMSRDVAAARRLLADAGYPDGFATEITVKRDPPWELLAVEEMVRQWKEAGVRVRIKMAPTALFWELWDKVPFGFTEWAHDSLGIINLGLGYRSGAPWNESGYANPEFDALLNEAEGLLDLEARRAVMARIERLLQEDGPIVQPLWLGVFTAYDKRVQGFTLYPNRAIHANELAIEV